MSKILLTLSIVVSLTAGFFGGWKYGLVDAEKKINDSLPETSRGAPILTLYGAIQDVKNGAIFMQGPTSPNPLEKLPPMREVVIGPDIAIVKRTQKSAAVFAEEQAQFLKDMRNSDPSDITPPLPPQLFIEEKLKFEDLKVGDIVTVNAGEDIRTERKFEAVSVKLEINAAAEGISTSTSTNAPSGRDPALTPQPSAPSPPSNPLSSNPPPREIVPQLDPDGIER